MSIPKTSVQSVFIIEIRINNHLAIVTAVYVIAKCKGFKIYDAYDIEWDTSVKHFLILVYNDIISIRLLIYSGWLVCTSYGQHPLTIRFVYIL